MVSNVNRSWPETWSIPMVPSMSPRQALNKPLTGLLPNKTAILAKPNVAVQEISAGPNARATLAKGGAMVIRATALAMPPMAKDTTAFCKA